ncbi:hypothetical protein OSB04_004750 [Centaurea solstitialis]|uniref:Histidine-containing phosphotransfer protein n=1 Tax=Centaurea solstitialis TaxID=347529 RepID=A0AA38TEP1_9ASTR|nr:hypothetical protein OSB04_004750 [Centaurea solstitialis]
MLGFGAVRLRTDMNRLLSLLFHQGVLDEQFLQLQHFKIKRPLTSSLKSSPSTFTSPRSSFETSETYYAKNVQLEREMWDYCKLGIHLNQLMGSSSSIGAKRVRNICAAFRAAVDQNNRPACMRALEVLEHEYCYLKNKLHELFQVII